MHNCQGKMRGPPRPQCVCLRMKARNKQWLQDSGWGLLSLDHLLKQEKLVVWSGDAVFGLWIYGCMVRKKVL